MKRGIFAYRRKRTLRYREEFEKFVSKLRDLYRNKITIILFGSRAKGEHMESSDYDILIILEKKGKEEYEKIYKMKPPNLPADIVIITPQDLKKKTIKLMLKKSKKVFDGLNIETEHDS